MSQSSDSYVFNGIYQARNIETLSSFFTSGKLPNSEVIIENTLTGKPDRGWRSSANGKILNMINFGSKSQNLAFTNINAFKTRVNSYSYQGSEECTYWYWVVYNPITGEITSSRYLYSTGCGDADGGGFTGGLITNECGKTDSELMEILGTAQGSSSGDIHEDGGGETYDPASSLYRRPKNSHYNIFEGRIATSEVQYTVNFTGAIVSPTIGSYANWTWETFAYANTILTSGAPMNCTGIITSTTCSATIDGDGKFARTEIDFTYHWQVLCGGDGLHTSQPVTISKSPSFDAKAIF